MSAGIFSFAQNKFTVIKVAKANAAGLLGWAKKVGSINVEKYADIIAVESNPLDDVSVLGNVKFVMKGGIVYKNVFLCSFISFELKCLDIRIF